MDVNKLESFILERIKKTRIPSLSIAIVKNNEIVYMRGFGFRDIDKGLPATPNTIYGIGSITKSFTALAILKLVEQGKLDLHDPIDKYVPLDIRPFNEPIRVHHLLTHSSGIPALAYAEAFIRGSLGLDKIWLPLVTPEDIISFMRDVEEWVEAKPGNKFFYLNEGYVLLGYIVSKVSGMKYEDFVRKYILCPLEMNRTYFYSTEVERDSDVATPYIIDKDGKHIPSKFPYGITADGGLLSNTVDMSKYIIMYLNRGEYKDRVVIGKEYIELMERKYIEVPWKLFGDEGYGYGLMVTEKFLGRKLVQHSGSVLVYTAYMGYLPSDKIGVIVLANASGYPLSTIGIYALTLALGRDPEKELEFLRKEHIIESLEGVYETYKGTHRYIVKRQGDFLVLHYKNRYLESTTILVPEEINEDYARFFTLYNGRKMWAEFYRRDGKTILIFERYKLVKRADITS